MNGSLESRSRPRRIALLHKETQQPSFSDSCLDFDVTLYLERVQRPCNRCERALVPDRTIFRATPARVDGSDRGKPNTTALLWNQWENDLQNVEIALSMLVEWSNGLSNPTRSGTVQIGAERLCTLESQTAVVFVRKRATYAKCQLRSLRRVSIAYAMKG